MLRNRKRGSGVPSGNGELSVGGNGLPPICSPLSVCDKCRGLAVGRRKGISDTVKRRIEEYKILVVAIFFFAKSVLLRLFVGLPHPAWDVRLSTVVFLMRWLTAFQTAPAIPEVRASAQVVVLPKKVCHVEPVAFRTVKHDLVGVLAEDDHERILEGEWVVDASIYRRMIIKAQNSDPMSPIHSEKVVLYLVSNLQHPLWSRACEPDVERPIIAWRCIHCNVAEHSSILDT